MMRYSLLGRLLDAIYPRQCPICGQRLYPSEGPLCCACNLHLPRTHFARQPYDNIMAQLFWGRIPIERAAALFYYHAHAKSCNTIYQIKYGGREDLAISMGRMMAKEFDEMGFFEGITSILPIPLAWSRQIRRTYNQSERIARGIQEVTHLPILRDAVKRKTFRSSQTDKNFWQRTSNVKGAFSLQDARKLSHQHILIIDDVVTTGATITACATELLKAEDVKISVASLGFTER